GARFLIPFSSIAKRRSRVGILIYSIATAYARRQRRGRTFCEAIETRGSRWSLASIEYNALRLSSDEPNRQPLLNLCRTAQRNSRTGVFRQRDAARYADQCRLIRPLSHGGRSCRLSRL